MVRHRLTLFCPAERIADFQSRSIKRDKEYTSTQLNDRLSTVIDVMPMLSLQSLMYACPKSYTYISSSRLRLQYFNSKQLVPRFED